MPVKLPSITVVTPCLNAAATIGEALESVRSQGYPGLEHLVMDGGSTDGTLEIVRSFEHARLFQSPTEVACRLPTRASHSPPATWWPG